MKAFTGNEHFYFDDMPTPHLLLDFWAWSSSDLLKGTLRGSLAEFIVATAIGEDVTQMHEDLYAYDLEMVRGGETCLIEVKSSAYINTGAHEGLSTISFDIAPSRRSVRGQKILGEKAARRASDVYVFCLFTCKDRKAANPLILDDWSFIVIPTPTIDWSCGGQKSISLRSLLKLRVANVDYGNLGPAVEAAFDASKGIRDYIRNLPPPPRILVYFDDCVLGSLWRGGPLFGLVYDTGYGLVMVLVLVMVSEGFSVGLSIGQSTDCPMEDLAWQGKKV